MIKQVSNLFQHIDRGRKKQLLLLLVTTIITAFVELISLGLLLPFFAVINSPDKLYENPIVMKAIDEFGISGDGTVLWIFGLMFIFTVILSSGFRFLNLFILSKVAFGLGNDLQTRLLNVTLSWSYEKFTSTNSSALTAIVGKANYLVFTFIVPLLQIVSFGIISLIILTGLILLNPLLVLSSVSIIGFCYVFATILVKKKLHENGKKLAIGENLRMRSIAEAYGGYRDIALEGTQEIFINRFKLIDQQIQMARASNSVIGQAPRYAIEAIVITALVLFSLSLSLSENGLVAWMPAMVVLAFSAQRLLPMVQQIYQGVSQVQSSRSILQEILDILATNMPVGHLGTRLNLSFLQGSKVQFDNVISLKNVSYHYPAGTKLVLEDVSIEIENGSRIGIFGKTGSGKSTLVDILMGLLQPTDGEIMVDGKVVWPSNVIAYRRLVAHVPQSIFLADASIADNIAFGKSAHEIDWTRVQTASVAAQLDNVVNSFPEGLKTRVGERGVMLSGGQRQRIGIARALYKGAKILIFDEATSALDTETEKEVISAVNSLSKDITVIMIAHRLSTLAGCDFLIEVDGGKVRKVESSQLIISEKK